MRRTPAIPAVTTPASDPVGYDLDWRYRMAQAAAKGGEGPKAAKPEDPVVAMWARYLKDKQRVSAADRRLLETALGWSLSALAGLLQPALLSEAGYPDIAADLGGLDEAAVALYERSFFNVREPDGSLRPPALLAARFLGPGASPVPAYRAALQAGYSGVLAVMGLPGGERRRDETGNAIQAIAGQQLLERVLSGQVATRDLIRIQQLAVAQDGMRFKQGKGGDQDEALSELTGILLAAIAPRVVPVEEYAHLQFEPPGAGNAERRVHADISKEGAEAGFSPDVTQAPCEDKLKAWRASNRLRRDKADLRVNGPDGKPRFVDPAAAAAAGSVL